MNLLIKKELLKLLNKMKQKKYSFDRKGIRKYFLNNRPIRFLNSNLSIEHINHILNIQNENNIPIEEIENNQKVNHVNNLNIQNENINPIEEIRNNQQVNDGILLLYIFYRPTFNSL